MTSVQYGSITGIAQPVSRVLLGVASIPERADANAWLSSILETGVNFFDTARVYDQSEETLGRWFDECGTRQRVALLSKCCHPFLNLRRVSAKAIRRDLRLSLQALRTDYIDLYLLHRDDPAVPVGEIVETLNELKAAGKIRAFGGSNWTHSRIEAADEYAYSHNLTPFSASSPNFSLADPVGDPWGHNSVSIAGRAQAEARAWYAKTQLPVIAYSALARGLFSGRLQSADADRAEQYLDIYARRGYASAENFERLRRCEALAKQKNATVPQIAMAWAFQQGLNLFAIVSTSSAERMRANIAALDIALSKEECRYLNLEGEQSGECGM